MGEPSGESSKKRRRSRKRDKKEKSKEASDDDEDNAKTLTDNDKEDTPPQNNDEEEDSASKEVAVDADADDGAEATEEQKEGEGDEDAPKKRKRKRKRKTKASADDAADGEANQANESEAAKKLASVEHTVFIEGLPFTSTEDKVRMFFDAHGCSDILQLRLPTWQDSGRLRGFGHVVFASKETRAHALSDEVNGKELGGRYITVKEANAPKAGTTGGAAIGGQVARDQPTGCKTVYVRNLPYDASEDQILETFRACGKIVEGGVRVVRNHANGVSKGFGYVEYKNEEGALAAVQKAAKPFGLTVLKRPVFVDYDEGSMKGSFRDGEGKLWSKEHGDGGGSGGRGGAGRGGGPGRGGGGRGRGGGRGGFGMGRGPR